MKQNHSKLIIFAALIANALIAISKFSAAIFTHSSAMFSEGIHSLVDVGNQVLLLFGLHRSHKKADRQHPFGYGKEIYFWSFIVAILLFSLGGGLSLYEGIKDWFDPHPIQHAKINYLVLCVAFMFESIAWLMAYRQIKRTHPGLAWRDKIERAKDPALIVVLLEDSAAMIGLILAFIGISLSLWFDAPRIDAATSMMIGVLLITVAFWLAREIKELLIGEAADPQTLAQIKSLILEDKRIEGVRQILSMHMGPDDVLVNLYVDFKDDLPSQEVEQAISDLEAKIKTSIPAIQWLFIAAQSFKRKLPEA